MNDLERDLAEMFRRREGDVRGPWQAPAGIVGRIRRRQASISLLGVIAGLALLAASFGVLRSIATSTSQPAAPSQPPSVSSPHWYRMASAKGPGFGGTWQFSAYHNAAGRLCSVLQGPDNVSHKACGELPGVFQMDDLVRPAIAGVARGAAIFGPITDRAATVRLRIDGGGGITGRIIPSRETFQFFVVIVDRPGSGTLVGIDDSGAVVAARRVSW